MTSFPKIGRFALISAVLSLLLSRVEAKTKRSPRPAGDTPVVNVEAKKAEPALLRLWYVGDSPGAPALSVRLVDSEGKEIARFEPSGGLFGFGSYSEAPCGGGALQIFSTKAGGSAALVKTLPTVIGARSKSTLIVSLWGQGEAQAEMMPETTEGLTELKLFNFLPASFGDVQASVGDLLTAHIATQGGSASLRGMPKAPYSVNFAGKGGAAGKPFHWTTEVDYRHSRAVAVVLCVDAYGRPRSRTIVDDTGGSDVAGAKSQ